MKRYIQFISIFIFTIILLIGLLYIGLAVYYSNGFSYGTFINGIYCTGKSVEEVNKELNENFHANDLKIKLRDGVKQIDLQKIDYSYDFMNPLEIYLNNQNSFLWIENLFIGDSGVTLYPKGLYDENKFDETFSKLRMTEKNDKDDVRLVLNDSGYVLIDPKANVLDENKTKTIIEEALLKGYPTVNLDTSNCYKDASYSNNELHLIELYPQIKNFQNKDIIFQFGDDERKITSRELSLLIECDETGIPTLDDRNLPVANKDEVKNLIDKLGREFNTYCNHYFTTHSGEIVYIDSGNYGNEINAKTETEWLFDFISNGGDIIVHEPEYIHTANFLGKNDIGNTYIEISLSEQKLYYYKNGEIALTTDVVTGNTGRKRGTPQKVCFVYAKQERRILKGPGYSAFVNFWMPVSGNIGIHDASWRSEYGGNIYKTSGSHGCINTPYDKMKELYGMVDIGTPVIIYELSE